jgi:hypothetical protein
MQLSIVDAQDIYMSAKAFTALTISELEAEWHQPAIEKLAKVMTALSQGAQTSLPMPEEMQEPEAYGGNYGADKQNLL